MMGRRGVLAALAALALASAFLWRPGRATDLNIAVSCARVLAAGGDPYARDLVIDGVTYPCLYPPLALDLFRPLAALLERSPGLGARAWNALQVLLFLGMLYIWRRRFLAPGFEAAHLLFALFAFGGPLWVVLRSGNIASVEHILLWTAFALYAAGHDMAFVATIALAAQFKLQPSVFLILVLLRPRPAWGAFAAGAAAMLLLFGLNEVLHPGLLLSFRDRLADPSEGWPFERGPNNCAVLGFIQHALETAWADRSSAVLWSRRLFIPWALFVAAATGAALRRAWAAARDESAARRAAVLLVCAAYALLAPRFKDYAYFLLLPSALAALESGIPNGLRAAIVVLAVLNSTKAAAMSLGMGPWALFAGYFKLYAAVLVWGVLVLNKNLELPVGKR